MEQTLIWIKDFFVQISWIDIVDIIIITVLIYQLLKLTSQTRAFQVLKGFGLIIVAAQVSIWLKLSALSWVFNYVLSAGAIVLVILFQPELRRTLERIGRGKLLTKEAFIRSDSNNEEVVDSIIKAVQRMSGKHVGALIVIENNELLGDVVESGTALFANISTQLLENIFTPNTPLHDGAVIIRNSTIIAAGCFLPMTADPYLEQELGTRHRAAIGLSENSDALIVIVSEETGGVSVANEGKLERFVDGNSLRKILSDIYEPPPPRRSFGQLLRRKNDEKDN
ncbi:MAG: diadenylate cyclase CdaA [Clostridiales bacterium]|nr:diadenylate cyclase CdaA [Clostridiales bacterium]